MPDDATEGVAEHSISDIKHQLPCRHPGRGIGPFCVLWMAFGTSQKYELGTRWSVRLLYSIILLYRSSGDRDEYFDISKFRYNRSSFVLTLCPAGLQIKPRYKWNFDISKFDIAGLCCTIDPDGDVFVRDKDGSLNQMKGWTLLCYNCKFWCTKPFICTFNIKKILEESSWQSSKLQANYRWQHLITISKRRSTVWHRWTSVNRSHSLFHVLKMFEY